MKSFVITFVASYLLAIGLIMYFGHKEYEDYQQDMNKRVVINNDTLTIVDFDTTDANVTLSNGVKIDKVLADQLITQFNQKQSWEK